MRKITNDYYLMKPFRQWAKAVSYLSAGYFAVVSNIMSPMTNNELQYAVYR